MRLVPSRGVNRRKLFASLLRPFVAIFFTCFSLLCFGQTTVPARSAPGPTGISGLGLPSPITANPLPCVGAGCLARPKRPKPLVPSCVADGCPREPLEPKTPPEPVDPCVADACPRSSFTSDVKDRDTPLKDEPESENQYLTRQEKCQRACNNTKAACLRDKKNGCDVGAMTCYTGCL